MNVSVPVLDVGGTHVTAALVGSVRQVLRRTTVPLDAGGDANSVLATIAGAARAVEAGPGRVWGVAIPGPFDYALGRGSFAGVSKFAALAGQDLRQLLSQALATTGNSVRFLNDADAYALGEWAAQGQPARLCCVTLGTGVGGGFVEAGRILTTDPRVPMDGDLYHLTWRGDPLEEHVSRRAILRKYGPDGPDVSDLAELALAGDDEARQLFTTAMTILAEVLAPWIASFRPEALVIGGAIAGSWPLIGPPLAAALSDELTDPPPVRPSVLRQDAPLVGAAAYVRSHPTPTEGITHESSPT